jgi:Lrp/AsnC family transcriptional regulator, leucine-responsive regulatory protein
MLRRCWVVGHGRFKEIGQICLEIKGERVKNLSMPKTSNPSAVMVAPAAARAELDSYDTRILAELQSDARLSLAELGRRVHLSQPAVAERVRKLEGAGVITGYHASVNLAALGYGLRAVVRVGRCDYERMVKLIARTPEVVNAFNVTGDDSWALEIAVTDVGHLDTVITQFCLLGETATSIILKTLHHAPVMLPPAVKEPKP